MNVSLTPELEKLVAAKVKTGLYQSASEVIREALRLLRTRDEEREASLKETRRQVAIGLNQLERGEFKEFTPKTLKAEFQRIKQSARQRMKRKKA